ncbi:cupin domain-containing protein [Pannonibacter sp. Pt2-lr]|uniref:Cupin domain-containing protein n=1 Tax=Pannonibacter anstelovis TaxID=3121537 RepID=A0ABU7ZQJ2_9HYPH
MALIENGSIGKPQDGEAAPQMEQPGGATPVFRYAALNAAAMRSAPIRPEWIIEGMPQARLASLSTGTNGWSSTDHWECTAGKFHWHFFWDETVLFLEGEVHITDEAGNTYEGRPGVSMLFPAGTRAVWHVPVYVRKIAFNRRPMPWIVSFLMKVTARLGRLFGRS